MVETETMWKTREGVDSIVEPFEQPEIPTDYTMASEIKFAREDAYYQTYMHMSQIGKAKLLK